MRNGKPRCWRAFVRRLMAVAAFGVIAAPAVSAAQTPVAAGDVTYSKDIAPILHRSCENCHREDGVAPMSLQTYEEVRPWARAIKTRTGIGPRAGVMPPWYMEKNIGIQKYKNDPSLSRRGDRQDCPLGRQRCAARQPDRHAARHHLRRQLRGPSARRTSSSRPPTSSSRRTRPTGGARSQPCRPALTEDRYVVGLEVKEVNDARSGGERRARRSAAASCSTT